MFGGTYFGKTHFGGTYFGLNTEVQIVKAILSAGADYGMDIDDAIAARVAMDDKEVFEIVKILFETGIIK